MPGALVADEIGLGKTLTSVAAAMICKLLSENVIIMLLLSIMWGNTLDEWEIIAQNHIPRSISDEREWYLLRRQHGVPCCLARIQSTQPQGHPALTSDFDPILVVTMPGVAVMIKSVIDEMTYGTCFQLINLFHTEYANLTHNDLNTSIDEPET